MPGEPNPYGTAVDPETLGKSTRRAQRQGPRVPGDPGPPHGIMGRLEVDARGPPARARKRGGSQRDQGRRLPPRGDRLRALQLRPPQRGASASRNIAVSAAAKRRGPRTSAGRSREPRPEAGVGEVGRDRAVDQLHELDGVMRPQPPGGDLALQEPTARSRNGRMCSAIAISRRPPPSIASRRQMTTKS